MSTPHYKLAASLICASMLDLDNEIRELEAGGIDQIHFDVMDGHFVPRLGLHPEMLAEIRSRTAIPIDVHVMMENPEPYIPGFIKAGANYVVVHAESTHHLHRLVRMIRDLGAKAGVALNPSTPLDVLDYVLDEIDLVMLMAINPGIVGHKLIPKALDKIVDLKAKLVKYPDIIIEVDGGVTFESAPLMVERGATMLVCGTGTIYRPPATRGEKIKELRMMLDSAVPTILS